MLCLIIFYKLIYNYLDLPNLKIFYFFNMASIEMKDGTAKNYTPLHFVQP